MHRRSFLLSTVAMAAVSGCLGETDAGQGDRPSTSTTPTPTGSRETDEVQPGSVEGEFLASESDPSVEIEHHAFEKANDTSYPYAVVGVVSQSSGDRADIQVSVNFLDEDNTVINDTYELLTDIASDQSAEFSVRYNEDDPGRVETYELIAEVR